MGVGFSLQSVELGRLISLRSEPAAEILERGQAILERRVLGKERLVFGCQWCFCGTTSQVMSSKQDYTH